MERAVPFVSSLVVVIAVAGCSLPRAALGAPDGGGIDAFVATLDVGPRDDTGLDAFVVMDDAFTPPDVGTIDVGVDAYVMPDMGTDAFVPPVDAYVAPDTWAGDASTPCDRAFGGAMGYHVCGSSTAASCVFYVSWGGNPDNSCDAACGPGHCTRAIGNADGTQCSTADRAFPCAQTFHDAICTCTP